jgi:hypothetical protein
MKKVQLNDTYGYENFITAEENNILLNWINENHTKFNVNQSASTETLAPYGSRKFCTSDKIDNFPKEIVKKIKDRVIQIENIKEWIEEPTFKDLIGINGEGGSIHLHTDPNVDGYVHVRYNVILKYPTEGGHSIYNGKINELKENMVWRCVAGKVMHGSVPVVGDIPRITLSLGFQIKETEKKVRSLL